jgi:hypothetical protein
MTGTINNKVDAAGLITLDVSSLQVSGKRFHLDLAGWLENGLIIKEVSFKEKLNQYDWPNLRGHFVSVFCSTEAIIPPWAYLLIQIKLRNIAQQVFFCSSQEMEMLLFQQQLDQISLAQYKNKRVFLKVCGNKEVPLYALSLCVHALAPHVKSLFYGEPCSSIPLIKN